MPDLLLELFSEEIPARMQADAAAHLQGALEKAIGAKAKMFSTPRRIAAVVNNLPEKQPDISQELKGPKIDAPEAALQGFLKKNNLTIEQLEKRDGVYFANVHQKGKATADVLRTAIEDILKSFPWPKSMRWGANETTWVRPLHSIICLFDGKIIPVEFAGVKAGNTTHGHRFLAPAVITIASPAEYEAKLEKAFVIADREKRKAKILEGAEKAAAAKKLSLKKDDGLLEEVTGLVEWPVPLAGKIDANYMDLPQEVLVSEMRAHQKYFALLNKDGSLADTFLITSNMTTDDQGKAIIAGNERVLRARLADGRFFWDQDRKKPLADWAKGLETVTYHAKLGSVADKVSRVTKLAITLADIVKADKKQVERAAQLCKADLVTGMVGEFPELQGVMGRYYALAAKEDAFIADAIRDHYKPQGPADSVPHTPVTICVALADKLDTLISMFAIGEKPTGSKDPFALRRAALGVIRIILDNNLRLPLSELFKSVPNHAIARHKAQEKLVKQTEESLQAPHKIGKYLTVNETASADVPEGSSEKLAAELLAFFHDRLIVQLKDSGIRHDVIKAVIADGDDDLLRIVARAKAVQDFTGAEDGKNLLAGYKRAANIVTIEEKKDKIAYKASELKTTALKDPEEKSLADMLEKQSSKIAALCKDEKFAEAMKLLAELRAPVDQFFDKTMVNCDDKDLRANRLRLLASIKGSMDGIANFAIVEG